MSPRSYRNCPEQIESPAGTSARFGFICIPLYDWRTLFKSSARILRCEKDVACYYLICQQSHTILMAKRCFLTIDGISIRTHDIRPLLSPFHDSTIRRQRSMRSSAARIYKASRWWKPRILKGPTGYEFLPCAISYACTWTATS